MVVNVEKEILKEIMGVKDAIKKNYYFMMDSNTTSGVSIIEQVRFIISELKYDIITCNP